MSDDLLAEARAYLAEERRRTETQRARRAEFPTFRPTPNVNECDRAALGEIVTIKEWDLSPIDPQSFDPFEPPGRPAAPVEPPVNTVAPVIIAIGGLAVGEMLVVSSNGAWTGSPTYARQWRRGATNINGATGAGYTLADEDVGQMITCEVTATNADGSAIALSNAIGPITA